MNFIDIFSMARQSSPPLFMLLLPILPKPFSNGNIL